MDEKSYHHGNLKKAFIEAGIELINKEVEAKLSLRKVAAMCQVTHTAMYTHFSSKEELITAMQNHVTEHFMDKLIYTVEQCGKDSYEAVISLGTAYVKFFIENPQCFQFMFSNPFMKINLTMDECEEDTYPPYKLFKNIAFEALKNAGYKKESLLNKMINMWSTVQGLAFIATMKNVIYDKEWEIEIGNILRNQ